ncbi:hypothetical protein DPMN_027838 [Dreissena polymorpha]|uniref:Uncharacterized protein n=1 Tax=Dreissena polymorpha TaxID=45954 RepID=A0A9D4RDT9_DREPO|nr:hypothetical protein DPMN_027838 [Dreissena polymorpha]
MDLIVFVVAIVVITRINIFSHHRPHTTLTDVGEAASIHVALVTRLQCLGTNGCTRRVTTKVV